MNSCSKNYRLQRVTRFQLLFVFIHVEWFTLCTMAHPTIFTTCLCLCVHHHLCWALWLIRFVRQLSSQTQSNPRGGVVDLKGRFWHFKAKVQRKWPDGVKSLNLVAQYSHCTNIYFRQTFIGMKSTFTQTILCNSFWVFRDLYVHFGNKLGTYGTVLYLGQN